MQYPCADVYSKQVTCGFFWASRHVYGHQHTSRKIGTCRKRRHRTIPKTSFVIQPTRVTVSLYAALSMEVGRLDNRPPVLETSMHSTSGKWECCKHIHFLINDQWCGFTVFQDWPHNMSVVSSVRPGRSWRSICSSATHWFHILMIVNGCWPIWFAISWNDNPHFREETILPLTKSDTCWYAVLLLIQGITR